MKLLGARFTEDDIRALTLAGVLRDDQEQWEAERELWLQSATRETLNNIPKRCKGPDHD